MARELKFRAWIEKNNEMEYGISLNRLGQHSKQGEDAVVMQFTGLKDKNGKEIYEGDLLRAHEYTYSAWDRENYTAWEVFFHDGNENMDYNIGFSMNRAHHQGAIAGGYIPSFKPKTVANMEVIGNIYETPELLKQSTA